MQRNSLKDKGNLVLADKLQLMEEIKRNSPKKKSMSANLELFSGKKLLSAATGSSTTLGSEIKQLLRQMIEQNKEIRRMEIERNKRTIIDKTINLPRLNENSLDSSFDSYLENEDYVTMKDIPTPNSGL